MKPLSELSALDAVARATIILALAALADALLRRRGSASARHLAWAAALVGALAVPALRLGLPGWRRS